MQPVTVAISPTGIQYLLKSLLGDQIAQALHSNLKAAPTYGFQPNGFSYYYDDNKGNFYRNDYSNISVNISGGQFQNVSAVFSGGGQGPDDNSQFTIAMTVSNVEADYPSGWNETYTLQPYKSVPVPGGAPYWAPNGPSQPCNNTYNYSVNLPSLTIDAVFKLSVSGRSYELTYVQSSADAGNPQPNIPGGSILNQQPGSCGDAGTHISAATVNQIDSMDYGSCVAAVLNPIFASIGESGQLGPVTFDFLAPSDHKPTPLLFPSAGGIQIGAKGAVSANGTTYSPSAPTDLPFPPIPTGTPPPHVTYFVQDYEVNALFWGFFFAGVLKTSLSRGDIKDDPQALMTDTYQGTSLNTLWSHYKNRNMTADLTALVEPTVSFTNIYQFTSDNLAKVEQDVGGANTQYGKDIAQLTPGTYSGQAGLEQALNDQDSGLMPYAATIEQDIAVPGVVVAHMVRCVLNVEATATDPPAPAVITFDVPQTFVMQDLQLGPSSTGKTQSVIFTFIQPLDIFPQPIFVSSTLPGVNNADFNDVWTALRANWQQAFSAIGAAGLPLPRIPGFDFLFDQAAVTVNPAVPGTDGYFSITTNLTYSPQTLAPAVKEMLAKQKTLRMA
jgi:hypothetical protein